MTTPETIFQALYTVNSEIFRENFIFASSVKDIFATLKFRDYGMIYQNQ